MFKKILCPLDGSELSEQGLEYARDMARLYQAELHLLRVRTIPMAVWKSGEVYIPPDDIELPEVEQYLSGLAERLTSEGLKVTTFSPSGDASEGILDHAQEHQVDLIVMSSHGRTGFRRWLTGSVAERVVRHSPCPCLIIGLETLRRRTDD